MLRTWSTWPVFSLLLTDAVLPGTVGASVRNMGSMHPYCEILHMAAMTAGGAARLAERLGVNRDELSTWMAGEKAAPLDAIVTALDLLDEWPYVGRREEGSPSGASFSS